MSCKEILDNIEAYLDGELTLSDRRDVEDHLADCADCQAELERRRALGQVVRKTGYTPAPAALKRNIKAGLKDLTGEAEARFGWSQLIGFSGGSALVASISVWAVMSFLPALSLQTRLHDDLITAHVHSMLVDHVTDVASSDRHTVKPWFNGKLDFSPQVHDFSQAGFPLKGGRLDYLRQRPVAALVYQRRAHLINLFISRADDRQPRALHSGSQQGFNLLSWHKQGLAYHLVSDLNKKELAEFAQLLIQADH
ncbi:MAG: anti-sigma factor [Gammaproteobacteria bacterium]|nr:anti-sigma factor [Gammaproteobacteria bacterium]MDH5653551.1 anti-sigma factor [Gammaproteobacteria bacterium]